MADNKYIAKQEIITHPGKKLPVTFLIDVSDSMNVILSGGTPTGESGYSDGESWNYVVGDDIVALKDKLIERLVDFNKAMKEDPKTSVMCQTSYITFGDKATQIDDFSLVKNKDVPLDKLSFGDEHTFIVDALEMAINNFRKQKDMLHANQIKYFQPWLIILTDGKAQDDPEKIKAVKAKLRELQENKKLTVYTMALGAGDDLYQQIRGYSIYKPIPYDKDQNALKEFFNFLKQSVSGMSRGKREYEIPSFTKPEDFVNLQ